MLSVAAASLCLWGALCLIFWLGSWQLLYHPKAVAARTPADAGLSFDSVDFATTESGKPQLHGWWIPGEPENRFTAIYLHGSDGNIGDTVRDLLPLHEAKLNLLVFDYHGYGTSAFSHPSERRWREDAEAAITYLRDTRHIKPESIVLIGSGLGANLACEVGAVHPELSGVVLDGPLISPEDVVFGDPRARLVPAHWLVPDRWDLAASATQLRIPSLWFVRSSPQTVMSEVLANAYDKVGSRKTRIWVSDSTDPPAVYRPALSRWVDELVPVNGDR